MSTLVEAVRSAAGVAGIGPQDRAALDLAVAYAEQLDGDVRCADCGGPAGGDLAKLGPALLAALEALGLTPRARKAVKSDGQQPSANPLDQLAARRAGKGPAASVDAGAS